MNYDSLVRRHELFVAAAVVGAHSNLSGSGFRQRDVKFLIELFTNWVDTQLELQALAFKNTQLMRYLEDLVKDGFARRVSRSGRPRYRLTRTGLLELVSRTVTQQRFTARGEFFFQYYFIKNYKPRIEDLIKAEGERFPYSLKLELEALLDLDSLLRSEVERAQRELKRIERRIEDAARINELVTGGLRKGMDINELALEVEKLYPYELNSRKPLRDLLREIPAEQRQWELREGNLQRIKDIWNPARAQLKTYIASLRELRP